MFHFKGKRLCVLFPRGTSVLRTAHASPQILSQSLFSGMLTAQLRTLGLGPQDFRKISFMATGSLFKPKMHLAGSRQKKLPRIFEALSGFGVWAKDLGSSGYQEA